MKEDEVRNYKERKKEWENVIKGKWEELSKKESVKWKGNYKKKKRKKINEGEKR